MSDPPATPPPPTDRPATPRSVGHYLLLLIFWGLALLSWLAWMGMFLYLLSRIFGADAA